MKTKLITSDYFTDTVKEMEIWVNEMDNYDSLRNISIFFDLTSKKWVAAITYSKD